MLAIERKDTFWGAMLRAWLEQHSARVRRPHAAVDTAVAQRCAWLHVPDKRGERDALIAATALVHGMAVVTRAMADF